MRVSWAAQETLGKELSSLAVWLKCGHEVRQEAKKQLLMAGGAGDGSKRGLGAFACRQVKPRTHILL